MLTFLNKIFAFQRSVTVLYYHRVAELPHDPQCLTVTPTRFRDQMRWLKQKAAPISLEALVSALRGGQHLPRRGVVVTFDDGYADNIHAALPILKESGIPTTVFVSSGLIGTSREFWWDDLERILLRADHLPEALQINISGQNIACRAVTTADRQRLYDLILCTAKLLPVGSRETLLAGLANWAGVGRDGRETHRVLTEAELRSLDAEPLITVGAHTVNHPMLSVLPPEEQEKEILGSKAALEMMLGHAVNFFSYPFGQKADFDNNSIEICRNAGFACSFSARKGLIRRTLSPDTLFELPRFCARNWEVPEFANNMNQWFANY